MKSTEQMKNEMEKRLENLEARRKSLESQASAINSRLGDVRQEIGRLTGAIAALTGEAVVTQPVVIQSAIQEELKNHELLVKLEATRGLEDVAKSFRDADEDPSKNEQPPAPQGFHWGTNSFGEDALIMDGVELPPMQEPIVPSTKVKVIEVPNEFDDPKNMY